MSEWKEITLGDLIYTNRQSIGRDYPYTEIQYLDTGSITRNRIEELQAYKLNEAPSRAKRLVQNGDIIYSSVRPNQLHYGFIENPKESLVVSTGFVVITCKKEAIEPKFLYYLLSQESTTEYLHSIAEASTSTYPSLKPSDIEALEFSLPPLPEQTAIASVLSSLDNKIDLLHRQNTTLEKMAETLFRQWFVEEEKEEWEMGKVSDYALHFKDSIHPQKNQSTLYFHFSIPSFDNGKNPVKELGLEIQSNKYKVPEYCILFSKLNPHKDKRVWLLQDEVEQNSICSTEFQVVLPKKKEHLYFLYGWLNLNENYNEIASGVGGTSGSHQRIDPNTIYDFQCPHVSDSVIENLTVKIEPLFKKQVINQSQIRTLTALRDTLLPKLMSGAVTVEL
ncbi:MAG: restriction endonuclease subunit S [Flavobacteriaceae bacterium]|nr:restriction endonuclease subunit S [Flavobacteriaceae bacterium]